MADLTRFIDRNPVLLREVRELAERLSVSLVGESMHITGHGGASFYTIDSVVSPSMNREVYVGRKLLPSNPENLELYFMKSLANLILLEELAPDVSGLLPLFMGAVVGKDGKYLSMIMEDYSQGKKQKIRPMSWREQELIPPSIRQVMEAPDRQFHYDDMAGAFIFVDDK